MTIGELKKNYKIKKDEITDEILLVKYIGKNKDVIIPGKVNKYNILLEESLFYDKNINNVTIEEGITTIPTSCFDSSSISSIKLPNSINNLEEKAFANCKNLKEIDIRKICKMGDSCFAASGLKEISFGNILTIPNFAFEKCLDLTKVKFSKHQKSIDIEAFAYTNINEINLKNIAFLQDGAFYGCDNLCAVNAPKLYSIKPFCFKNCRKLKTINVPKLANIYNQAFCNCYVIDSLTFENKIQLMNNALLNCKIKTITALDDFNMVSSSFFNAEVNELILKGKENNVTIKDSKYIKINNLILEGYTHLDLSYPFMCWLPNIEVHALMDIKLPVYDETAKNIILNIYEEEAPPLGKLKYNKITNYEELSNKEFSLQQINQILRAQADNILLSEIRKDIHVDFIREMIEIGEKNKNVLNEIKLIVCDNTINPLDCKIEINKILSGFDLEMKDNKDNHDER